MKKLLSGVTISLFLAAAPALAATPVSTDVGVALEEKVTEVWKVYQDQGPIDPLFTDMRSMLKNWGDADEVTRKRLDRAMEDLLNRCNRAKLVMGDTARLKAMIIDARVDRYLRLLWKEAVKRGATREQFNEIVTLLRHRAEVASQPTDISKRVHNAMMELMEKAKEGGTLTMLEMSSFEDELVKARLDRAIAWLEDAAVERNATREQFLYVRDLLTARARIWQKDIEFQNLVNELKRELEQLNERAMNAGLTRAEFMRFRERCLSRARGVVSGI